MSNESQNRRYIYDRIFYYRFDEYNRRRLQLDYDKRFPKTRRSYEWNQDHIAKLIGVSRVTISSLINGKTKLDINMIIKVSYLTGLTYNQVIQEEINLGLAEEFK